MIENVEEAIEQLKDYGDVTEQNIDEVIAELADSNVDVYNFDRRKWLIEEVEHIADLEDAISEFGWDGCDKDLDIAIGYAQYSANSELLREAWKVIEALATKD